MNKFMILCVTASLCSHVLVISLTGLIPTRGTQRTETVLTVDLKSLTENPETPVSEEKRTSSPMPFPQDESVSSRVAHEETVDLNSGDARYYDYLKKIKRKIDRLWTYPEQAYERKEEGLTVIRFSIDPQGSLAQCTILTSSGSELLDQVALGVVQSAAPYDPIPQNLNLSTLHIVANFMYRID